MPPLNDRIYKILKYLAQIVLPGSATLYFALSEIWGLPHGVAVVATITATNTFLGGLIGLSTVSYNKSDSKYDGDMVVKEVEGKKIFTLELNHDDPEVLEQKPEALFKVRPFNW